MTTHANWNWDLQGTDDPPSAGVAAPIGSTYRRTDTGELFVKVGPTNVAWRPIVINGSAPYPPLVINGTVSPQILASITAFVNAGEFRVSDNGQALIVGGGNLGMHMNWGGQTRFDKSSLAAPDPFVGTNDDVKLKGSTVWEFDTDVAGGTITGIETAAPDASVMTSTGAVAGLELRILRNTGLGTLTIAHNTGSAVGNRFALPGAVNKVILVNGAAIVMKTGNVWTPIAYAT